VATTFFKVMRGWIGWILLWLQCLAQDITVTLPSAENFLISLDNVTVTGASQDLSVIAGLGYNILRLSGVGQNFSQSLTPRLRIVQVNTQPSLGGCSSSSFLRPGGDGFQDQSLNLTVNSGELISAPFSFMMAGIYRFCYSADGSFGTDSSFLPVPFELRVTGARRSCSFDKCLEEFPWRCFIYADEEAPASSCVLRLDGLELFTINLARLTWGPQSDGTTWSCGPDDVSVNNTLAPLAAGPLSLSFGSQGREFALQALPGSAFSVQTCLCAGLDLNNDGASCNSSEEFVQRVGRDAWPW